MSRLKDGDVTVDSFSDAISEAKKAIGDAEKRSLTEYVLRRKVVLDFIEVLLQNVRNDTRDSSYQREDVLHSFICPVRAHTLSDGSTKFDASASHDLWIVDERLTFAKYFSSDVDFDTLAEKVSSKERPDILIFDYAHGLGESEQTAKVLIIELKRPGRTHYPDNENPHQQIERYIQKLKSGNTFDVRGRPIKLNENTVFYCHIVADIIGKLDDWTFSWQRTADGRGRIYRPGDGFKGTIELTGWDALLDDARSRNQAFFERAGISGKSYFSSD